MAHTKGSRGGGGDELTALLLNNQLVAMRSVVKKASVLIVRKNERAAKMCSAKKTTNEEQKESNVRRAAGKLQCIKSLRRLAPNDVSKFALVNVHSFHDLCNKNKSATPAEKALYQVATSPAVALAVDQFRRKYPTWPTQMPFLLQRLGKQYRDKQSFVGRVEGEEEDMDVVKVAVTSTINTRARDVKVKEAKKRKEEWRKEKLEKEKEEKEAKATTAEKRAPIPTSSSAVIRRFNLDDMFNGDLITFDDDEAATLPAKKKAKAAPRAQLEDEGEEDQEETEEEEDEDEEEEPSKLTNTNLTPSASAAVRLEKKFGEKLATDSFFKHAAELRPKVPQHLANKLLDMEENNPTPEMHTSTWSSNRNQTAPHQSRAFAAKRAPRPPTSNDAPTRGGGGEHPSWAAKRDLLAKQKSVKPTGTRITFDD